MRGRETITVKPQQEVDRLREPTGPAPESYTISGCLVWPRAAQEAGRGWVGIEGYGVLCPAGSTVPRTAIVAYDGEDYEVEGEPQDFGRRGVILTLSRVSSAGA